MGTPLFAVPSLEGLVAAGHDVALVVTQPDRRRGRGKKVRRTEVAAAADRLGLPVQQPEKVNSADFRAILSGMEPDIFAVVAFGQILGRRLLAIPRLGSVNPHASLLPAYRGAAPIQHAILGGESVTGITTILLDPGMDSGPMLGCREVPLGSDEDAGSLHDRLSPVAASLLCESIMGLASGALEPEGQDHDRATYAPRIEEADLVIDWTRSSKDIHRQVRAFSPRPGARTSFEGQVLQVLSAVQEDPGGVRNDVSGEIVEAVDGCPAVVCGEGLLRLESVRPAGRGAMDGGAWLRGRPGAIGARLGEEA